MIKKFTERFDQLADEISSIDATRKTSNGELRTSIAVDDELLLAWNVKVKNLLVAVSGKESMHYQTFVEAERINGLETNYEAFKRMKAIFTAAMDDYKGGSLTSIRNLVQAEVFDNQLEQARELLSLGHKWASAVAAGIVLETALRDLCSRQGLMHSSLDKMNADLARIGIYNELQQERIAALAGIRNSAAHGKSDGFSDVDVHNMIRDVEQFLIMHFV